MTAKDKGIGMVSVTVLSLLDYVEGALKRAEYYRDENREIINEIGISREEWINARSDMWRNSKNKNYCSSL